MGDDDSFDELSPGCYSCLESDRKVEPRPVLATAKRVKEILRLEASASKASSSSEQAAKKDEEAGTEFRQSLLFMRQTLPEAAVPQLTPVQPRAVAMSAHHAEETSKLEPPFSVYVKEKFAELSDELVGGMTSSSENSAASKGLAHGKPLSKPKYRMESYRVSKSVYSFSASSVDGPLREHDVREPDSVTIMTSMLQRLEQDARVLTMIGSFLDCSGFSANSLLDEASRDPRASETTRQLVSALSGLEKSRGRRFSTFSAPPLHWTPTSS